MTDVPLVAESALAHREDREHQVAHRRIEGVIIETRHASYRATRGVTSDAAALVAVAMQAGTPMPSR